MTENVRKPAPFSMKYVLGVTAKHMLKSVDVSIRKTFGRIEEFAEDQAKSAEIFQTLSALHQERERLENWSKQFEMEI